MTSLIRSLPVFPEPGIGVPPEDRSDFAQVNLIKLSYDNLALRSHAPRQQQGRRSLDGYRNRSANGPLERG